MTDLVGISIIVFDAILVALQSVVLVELYRIKVAIRINTERDTARNLKIIDTLKVSKTYTTFRALMCGGDGR